MRPPLRVGTVYDFRNTPESGMEMPTLYAAIMDQVVMLDGLGLDLVWFTEHHFLDDGYLPSWVPMAGAIAARTKRVRLSSDVCLLPFNHPVRLAEDLAVLDNISNGRIEVGVGMGYAPHERLAPRVADGRRHRGAAPLLHRREVQFPWQALRFRRRGDQAALRATGWPAALDRCDVGARRAARGTQ
jgi:hypothetical protein